MHCPTVNIQTKFKINKNNNNNYINKHFEFLICRNNRCLYNDRRTDRRPDGQTDGQIAKENNYSKYGGCLIVMVVSR